MSTYMLQASYTPEGLDALIKKPQDRFQAITPAIERLGGKLKDAYFCFGKYDIVVIMEMPDSVTAAAMMIAFGAGGALKSTKTTVLLTANEAVEAMKKAAGTGYKPATA